MNKAKKPSVVLFNPAPRSGVQVQRRIELPLSLLCPATPLARAGYNVKIIDEFANPHWREELTEAVKNKPICFGVTSMTGPQILHALEGCKLVKKLHPDIPIVWGGVHASLMPVQTLENPNVDIVVVGEGEEVLLEVVRVLESKGSLAGIKGAYYKDGKAIKHSAQRDFVDLNRQPPLSYDLIKMDSYRRRLFGQDHISFNSSRGCTFSCSFCWDPVMHKRRWRAMEPETVLEHLNRVIRDYGIRGFLFTDDHFFIDIERAYKIIEAVVKSDLNISISKLQIRADTIRKLKPEFLKLMVRAGVKRFSVGVESGSQRVLDLIRKDETVEDFIEANRKLLQYPIVPVYLFMMGLPTETPDDFSQSVKLALKLTDENKRAVKTFNIYTPYPGTELFNTAVDFGLKQPQRLEEWAAFNFRNVHAQAKWISPKMKKLIEGLDFPLMFLGKGHFVNPYKKTNPVVVSLARLYYPIARYRISNLNAGFPIETKLVKALGLFGRQD